MSIGGFKVFDIDSFVHTENSMRYVFMNEIRDVAESRTHLVNSDMHGMRKDTCSLFSSADVELLYQEDLSYNSQTTILFIKKCGCNYDSMGRECKVSACFMSETPEDEMILRNLTVAVTSDDEATENLLGSLLSELIINDRQVLAFDDKVWEKLKNHVKSDNFTNRAKEVFEGGKQVVVIHEGRNIYDVRKKLKGLFNEQPYLVFVSENGKPKINDSKLSMLTNRQIQIPIISEVREKISTMSRSSIGSILTQVADKLQEVASKLENKEECSIKEENINKTEKEND